jgi:hypothetical protein
LCCASLRRSCQSCRPCHRGVGANEQAVVCILLQGAEKAGVLQLLLLLTVAKQRLHRSGQYVRCLLTRLQPQACCCCKGHGVVLTVNL